MNKIFIQYNIKNEFKRGGTQFSSDIDAGMLALGYWLVFKFPAGSAFR